MQPAREVLRCVHCHASWTAGPAPAVCPACGRTVPHVDGIPILVRDPDTLERQIAQARQSRREAWYTEHQDVQWAGPYRHHVRKRIAYVEGAIRRWSRRPRENRVGLDAGCGDGEHHTWLAGHAATLYASDYNLLRLHRAAARGLAAAVLLADLTDYPAVGGAFDLVFCNHVLEHVPDDRRALSELRRILNEDGIVVIGVPNEGAAFWRLAYRLQPWTRTATDHVHFYTADSLVSRCREAGLEILDVHPIGWGLPHWALDARVRGIKAVDDAFEAVGRRVLRSQATSLYVVAGRA
jgi:2-polyprenyl-3-methyl-5-hydroxy-6-metoxy-1,4-benzoquinol methylase